jgi:hypothetical protein
VSACGGGSNNGGKGGSGGGGSGGGGGGSACSGTTVKANEANDYSFSSTLSFPAVTVAAKTELNIDWGGVTKDLLSHTVDTKKDLKSILVMLWKLPLATFEQKTNADLLLQRDMVTLPLQYPYPPPDPYPADGIGTSAKLFQFSNSGAPPQSDILSFLDPDAYPPEKYTYTLMTSDSTELGQGVRMIQSFHVSNSVTDTTVKITSDSTKLQWEAHIQNAQVTAIPAGQGAITMDWTDMKTNALGNPFVPSSITKVLVGRYSETIAELEQKFLDIEIIAQELYRGTVDVGTSIDLSKLTLTTDSNKHFAGISDSGTWLVALQCGACKNPAPWYLTVLKPCQ